MKVMSPELEAGINKIEYWCGLHREVTFVDLVDRHAAYFTDHDGDRLLHIVEGESVFDVIEQIARTPEIVIP